MHVHILAVVGMAASVTLLWWQRTRREAAIAVACAKIYAKAKTQIEAAATHVLNAKAAAAAAVAAGRSLPELFAINNKDVPVPAGVGKAIFDAVAKNDIAALTLLCVQWAGNTQAIDWPSPNWVSQTLSTHSSVFTSTRTQTYADVHTHIHTHTLLRTPHAHTLVNQRNTIHCLLVNVFIFVCVCVCKNRLAIQP